MKATQPKSKSEKVQDFEGLWIEGLVIGGSAECGMCAEYLLWWGQKGRIEDASLLVL